MKQVTFMGWKCNVMFSQYANNGRTAIQLFDAEDDGPVAKATVNIPEVPLEPNEVLIKDYAENAGILDVLVEAGIVRETDKFVPYAHIVADVCVLLVDPSEG